MAVAKYEKRDQVATPFGCINPCGGLPQNTLSG